MQFADSVSPDQHAHLPSHLGIFCLSTYTSYTTYTTVSTDSAPAQADQGLHCQQITYGPFLCIMHHML